MLFGKKKELNEINNEFEKLKNSDFCQLVYLKIREHTLKEIDKHIELYIKKYENNSSELIKRCYGYCYTIYQSYVCYGGDESCVEFDSIGYKSLQNDIQRKALIRALIDKSQGYYKSTEDHFYIQMSNLWDSYIEKRIDEIFNKTGVKPLKEIY